MSFANEVAERIEANGRSEALKRSAQTFLRESVEPKYSYNFSFLGRPIIQYPQDMVAAQELIWAVKPDLIIETGIAHGGSLIMSASMLALLDYCEAAEAKVPLDPMATRRRVLGLDIDIRAHNRAALEAHPMAHRIDMLQGSSIAPEIIARVHEHARGFQRILVFLDSNHTHEHALAELEAYAPLTSKGSYCVVFDTLIEDMPEDTYPDRPWGPGNNPKTAVREYLRRLETEGRSAVDGDALRFEVDWSMDNKLLITVAPSGFLRRMG